MGPRSTRKIFEFRNDTFFALRSCEALAQTRETAAQDVCLFENARRSAGSHAPIC